jgi:hypothetical protein
VDIALLLLQLLRKYRAYYSGEDSSAAKAEFTGRGSRMHFFMGGPILMQIAIKKDED